MTDLTLHLDWAREHASPEAKQKLADALLTTLTSELCKGKFESYNYHLRSAIEKAFEKLVTDEIVNRNEELRAKIKAHIAEEWDPAVRKTSQNLLDSALAVVSKEFGTALANRLEHLPKTSRY